MVMCSIDILSQIHTETVVLIIKRIFVAIIVKDNMGKLSKHVTYSASLIHRPLAGSSHVILFPHKQQLGNILK